MAYAAIIGAVISAGAGYLSSQEEADAAEEARNRPQTYRSGLPKELEELYLDRARIIGNSGASSNYNAPRVAGLSDLEHQAIGRLRGEDPSQRYLDSSRQALEGIGRLEGNDLRGYINPYIKGALDPAAREMDRRYVTNNNNLRAGAATRGAFGGSRQAILEAELGRNNEQNIGDLYGRGYAEAFDKGVTSFNADRSAGFESSRAYGSLGTLANNLSDSRTNQLFQGGGLERGIEQAGLDTDYSNYLDRRGFEFDRNNDILSALGTLRGSGEAQAARPNALATGIGAAASTYGLLGQAGLFNSNRSNQVQQPTNTSSYNYGGALSNPNSANGLFGSQYALGGI